MSQTTRILATRTLPEDQETRLIEAGFDFSTVNFIETRSLQNFDIPRLSKEHVILFSSQKAIHTLFELGFKNHMNGQTILCVGQKSADALEEYGVSVKEHFETAKEMAEYVLQLKKPTLFFTGNLRMRAIEDAFERTPSQLEVIEVYRTQLNTLDLSEDYDIILFLSPSSVEGFFFYNDLGNGQAVCIGETTTATAKKYTNNVHMASRNAIEAVVDKAIELAK